MGVRCRQLRSKVACAARPVCSGRTEAGEGEGQSHRARGHEARPTPQRLRPSEAQARGRPQGLTAKRYLFPSGRLRRTRYRQRFAHAGPEPRGSHGGAPRPARPGLPPPPLPQRGPAKVTPAPPRRGAPSRLSPHLSPVPPSPRCPRTGPGPRPCPRARAEPRSHPSPGLPRVLLHLASHHRPRPPSRRLIGSRAAARPMATEGGTKACAEGAAHAP